MSFIHSELPSSCSCTSGPWIQNPFDLTSNLLQPIQSHNLFLPTTPNTSSQSKYNMDPARPNDQPLNPANLGNVLNRDQGITTTLMKAANLGNLLNRHQSIPTTLMTTAKKLLDFLKKPSTSALPPANHANLTSRICPQPSAPSSSPQASASRASSCSSRALVSTLRASGQVRGFLCPYLPSTYSLTSSRLTGRALPVRLLRRSHARREPLCYTAIDGDARDAVASAGWRCGRERGSGVSHCVGILPRVMGQWGWACLLHLALLGLSGAAEVWSRD